MRSPPSLLRRWPALLLLGALATPVAANNHFCGGAATPTEPSDLANVVGDQTLEYAAQQPASMMTCAKGYLLEKCGDHENAHKVFDKCIAAGYAGAMIWKALLLDDGTGVARDPARAAELLHRAATSGDPAYAPLGKLHYATMLLQGKGVPKDEQAARQWFESAAADGNADAREYLRSGYHTGDRNLQGLGAGTPPPGASSPLLPVAEAAPATAGHDRGAERSTAKLPVSPPLRPATNPPPSPTPAAADAPASSEAPNSQLLRAVTLEAATPLSPTSRWLVLGLLLCFAAGIARQSLPASRRFFSISRLKP